jgi:hypothetical protein
MKISVRISSNTIASASARIKNMPEITKVMTLTIEITPPSIPGIAISSRGDEDRVLSTT